MTMNTQALREMSSDIEKQALEDLLREGWNIVCMEAILNEKERTRAFLRWDAKLRELGIVGKRETK